MKILPAIDIRNGKAVRLTQGDYDRMKVYSDSPLDVLKEFQEAGASCLHLVDLDGAKDGELVNFEVIRDIASKSGMFVEVGGGIRDFERIEKYLSAGVSRVILGTIAVKNYSFVEEAVKKYGDKIAVGVDASDGFVAINGWKEVTDILAVDFIGRLKESGVKTVIYTDISKDGKMAGTNLEIFEELSKSGIDIIASGGITFEDEIVALKKLGISGAILGKALYEGKLSLKRAIELSNE